MTRGEIDATILQAAANIMHEHANLFGGKDDSAGLFDLLSSCAADAAAEVEYYLDKLTEYADAVARS